MAIERKKAEAILKAAEVDDMELQRLCKKAEAFAAIGKTIAAGSGYWATRFGYAVNCGIEIYVHLYLNEPEKGFVAEYLCVEYENGGVAHLNVDGLDIEDTLLLLAESLHGTDRSREDEYQDSLMRGHPLILREGGGWELLESEEEGRQRTLELFQKYFPGKRLLALQLDGFSHRVIYDDVPNTPKAHAIVVSFCMGQWEELEHVKAAGNDVRLQKRARDFLAEAGFGGHASYQGNPKEIIFVEPEDR